jgi:transcriptional regulator with XRE-family HTH domain
MDKPPHFIREWRKSRGWTLEKLAERIGMSHQNLGKIERYQVSYTQPLLERLAEEFGTEPGSLIMRNPLDREAPWSLIDTIKPAEARPVAAFLTAIRGEKAGTDDR